MNKQAIKKISEEIIITSFFKQNELGAYAPRLNEVDYGLLEYIDKFKKFVGWVGDTFFINVKDHLKIPEGQYKILKLTPKKNDMQINVKKLDGKSFRKKFKLNLKEFLRRKHLW